jgi:hypothetical protein
MIDQVRETSAGLEIGRPNSLRVVQYLGGGCDQCGVRASQAARICSQQPGWSIGCGE